MNERIRELAEQAGFSFKYKTAPDELNPGHTRQDLEKFAELIIRECARSLWSEECHTSDLAVEEFNRNSKKIKQHFGVEE